MLATANDRQPQNNAGLGAITRILVLDDSRAQRRLIQTMLRRWGYDTIEAESGAEALEICQNETIDLILSDWVMPEMDGLEFCHAFRALELKQYVYFILLTSKSDKTEVAHGLEAGADDFLTKPVNGSELRARITAAERIVRMERELTEKNKLVSSTLKELQHLYNTLDHDLLEAKKLQQSLVPERYRDYGDSQVSMMLRPSGHVGGDLVGKYRVSDTEIGLFSIDVSGHGITSALMTARLAGYLSGTTPETNVALRTVKGGFVARSPAETTFILNERILSEMDTENYFTIIIANVNIETGHVTMCQAGHPHPAIQRASGAVEYLGEGGLPVGLIEGAEFSDFSFNLEAGDRMLLYSDGITECPDSAEELLDEEGLSDILTANHDIKGEALLETIVWDLQTFMGEDDFPDDLSAILFELQKTK